MKDVRNKHCKWDTKGSKWKSFILIKPDILQKQYCTLRNQLLLAHPRDAAKLIEKNDTKMNLYSVSSNGV